MCWLPWLPGDSPLRSEGNTAYNPYEQSLRRRSRHCERVSPGRIPTAMSPPTRWLACERRRVVAPLARWEVAAPESFAQDARRTWRGF